MKKLSDPSSEWEKAQKPAPSPPPSKNANSLAALETAPKSLFPDIDELNALLSELADQLPEVFFADLNLGIVLLSQEKLHPKSHQPKLYILGEYERSLAGRQIKLYYGSIQRLHSHLSPQALREELSALLLHEFTHHIESLAGERGLEVKDQLALLRYYLQ